MMKDLGYYNGHYDLLENMQVPMNDRGYYFGDGVYDASYMENNRIFDLDSHIQRFFRSAKLIGIELNFSEIQLELLLKDLAEKLEKGGYLAYWQVTRGTGIRKHYSENLTPNLTVMFLPSKLQREVDTMKVKTYPDKRYGYCNIKSLNLLPNVLGASYAEREECDEILFVREGVVTECAHSNVHMIKNNIVFTHPADNKILSGIARKHMLKACEVLGIKYKEKECSLEEFMGADEIFITSSATPLSRVDEVDGKKVGGHADELFRKMQSYIYSEMRQELLI